MQVAPHFPWSKVLAKFKFSLLAYLDDVLFVSYMPARRTRRLVAFLRMVFDAFGISLNEDKCVFEPSPSVDFLGYRVCAQGRLELTPKRLASVK